jgi:hypothetical protein
MASNNDNKNNQKTIIVVDICVYVYIYIYMYIYIYIYICCASSIGTLSKLLFSMRTYKVYINKPGRPTAGQDFKHFTKEFVRL